MAAIPKPQISFNPPVYICKRADKPFHPDGRLDKPFWEKAGYTELFVDIEGSRKPSPRFDTRAKMLWDDEYLYIGAELFGSEIWATQTERDCVIFHDNDFEVFIDPDGDTHEYIELEMNALNTVWDLLLTKPYLNGGTPINAFDIQGLRTAVYIDGELNNPEAKNNKWSVEIAIPLAVLNQCSKGNVPAEGVFWRMNFSRVQWLTDIDRQAVAGDKSEVRYVKRINPATGNPYPEDNWVWSPTGIINIHYPELWGYVFFTESDRSYQIPEDEKIRWQMRRIYYNEYEYYDSYGRFTEDTGILSKDTGNTIIPTVEVTSHSFEITCPNHDQSKVISLSSDGRFRVFPRHK